MSDSAPLCVASARTGRCPIRECNAKILVPFDYCDADSDEIDADWVRAGKRIIQAHTDQAHPQWQPFGVQAAELRT